MSELLRTGPHERDGPLRGRRLTASRSTPTATSSFSRATSTSWRRPRAPTSPACRSCSASTASRSTISTVFYLAGGFGRHLKIDASQADRTDSEPSRRAHRPGRQRGDRRRVHRAAVGERSATSSRSWSGASSTAAWKRTRRFFDFFVEAASSSRVRVRRSGDRDDRARRHSAGRRTCSRPSTSGCSDIRAADSRDGPGRASWRTGRDAWYAEHGRPWVYAREARRGRWRSPTRSSSSTA